MLKSDIASTAALGEGKFLGQKLKQLWKLWGLLHCGPKNLSNPLKQLF